MSEKKILIQVLNFNGEGILRDCLESIRENTELDEDNYVLLVVDNGSEDGSLETAYELADEVIENGKNLGFDIANNIGIFENPDFDYYMLMNNDTEVEEGWLSDLVETAESDEEIGIVGPCISYPDGEIQSAGFNNTKEYGLENIRQGMDKSEFNEVEEVDRVHGAALMISRNVINKIGYLDEIFSPLNFEEWDYCNRARKADFKIFVDGRSKITHKEKKTKENMQDEFRYFFKNKNRLKGKTMNRDFSELLTEYYIFSKMIAASLINYRYNPIKAVYKITKEFLIDLPNMMHKRYNRTEFVPSYYCEEIKDYSKRYD